MPRLPDPRRLLGGATAALLSPLQRALGGGAAPAGEGELTAAGPEGGDAGAAATKEQRASQGGGVAAAGAVRPAGPCPVCQTDDMLMPMVAVPCGHCFCYYCLASHTAADRRYECPCDGVRVAAIERWNPQMRVSTNTEGLVSFGSEGGGGGGRGGGGGGGAA